MRLYAEIRRANMISGGLRIQASIWTPDPEDSTCAIPLSKVGRVVHADAPTIMADDTEKRLREALRTLSIEEKPMPAGIAGRVVMT